MQRLRKTSINRAPVFGLSVAACLLVGLAGCDFKSFRTRSPDQEDVDVASRPPLPEPRPGGYVGSRACASCHPDIYADYTAHPMGQSLHAVHEAKPIEEYPSGNIDVPGPRRYRVEQVEDRIFHHEYLVDPDGQLIYDQGEEVHYALGSGQRGRAYLMKKAELLLQSPLGWYSSSSRWDLSPGYHPDSHARFDRRIGDGCLYCHTGQVASVGEDRYEPPFFLEPSIGCERCHGPGEQHVALHSQADSSLTDTIVNPAKLNIAERESVCNQCHLQGQYVIRRYGREFFDFRPGDLLEDVFVILMGEDRMDEQGRHRVVSHVEQMRSSRCYQESGATLGCTSCHDPHRQPPPEERVVYFNDRCLSCHVNDACSLPAIDQQAPPASGSCIHCHMPALEDTDVPHTAQTDHRIPRRLSELAEHSAPRGRPRNLPVFDGAEERLPAWEVARARGIALMTEAWNRQDPLQAAEARRQLLPSGLVESDPDAVLAALGEDEPVLTELGASYLLTGSPELAKWYWQRALELNPENETALGGLAVVLRQMQDFAGSQDALDRLLKIVPHDPQWHTHQAHLYWEQGAQNEALRAAERVLDLDPTRVDIRRWLVDAYRRTGQETQSQHQADILDRMERTLGRASPAPRR